MPSPIGQRINIMGNTGCGKSTLGQQLADLLDVSFVELDAVNWLPNWVGLSTTDPDEFRRRLAEATSGEGWVVAGSYSQHSERVFWDRLETVIWLDLPLPLILWRVLSRSWRRSRSHELLWRTNYERFWPQLALWRKDESLVWWAITQQRRKREEMLNRMADPRWSHIRFIRLTSPREVEQFRQSVAESVAEAVARGSDGESR